MSGRFHEGINFVVPSCGQIVKRLRGVLKQCFPYAIQAAYVEWRYGPIMRNGRRPRGVGLRLMRILADLLPFGVVCGFENRQMLRGEAGLPGFAERMGLFDRAWYVKNNPDVDFQSLDPLRHFFEKGWRENRDPSVYFGVVAYRRCYAAVLGADDNPLVHFLRRGRWEGFSLCGALSFPMVRSTRGETWLGHLWELLLTRFSYRFLRFCHLVKGGVTFPREAKSVSRTFALSPRRTGRVAVFAVFTADAKIHERHLFYLRGLKAVVDNVVLVSDNPILPEEVDKLEGLVCRCSFQRHAEYDFGSYKRGWQYVVKHAELAQADELILCNDSCYGPVTAFAPVFEKMAARKVDFWGMCDNVQIAHHIQSYFLCFSRAVFTSCAFADFLGSVRRCAYVDQVIRRYEVPFASVLKEAGFCGVSFVCQDDEAFRSRERFGVCLLHYPVTLLELGMPLVKVKALNQTHYNYEGLEATRTAVAARNPELAAIIDAEMPQRRPRASFSVILPTYNRRHCIARQLDALLGQTYRDFEVIVVDDGSTDGTEAFVRERYAAALAEGRIRYFLKPNGGVCWARNFGLARATRDWIAYADSDNEVYPNFLETFAQAIAAHPDSRTFYARLRMNGSGRVIGCPFSVALLRDANFIDLGVFVHHRALVETCGPFDTEMTRLVDWDLVLRYTEKFPPVYIPQILMLYDDRGDGLRISTKQSFALNLNHMRLKRGPSFIVTTMVTAYNHELFIAQALKSAVRQKGPFVHEILVSSDGSTDGTREVIRAYQARYPMIRDISEDVNVGVSANMKRCFDAASGRYVAVLEGDDYWSADDKLARQVAFLEENADCSMVFSRVELLRGNRHERMPIHDRLPPKMSGREILDSGTCGVIVNFSCCLFRTELVRNLPPVMYDHRLSEIVLMFYLERFGKIGFISTPMSVYRIHGGGEWSGATYVDKLRQKRFCREQAMAVCAEAYRDNFRKEIASIDREIEEKSKGGSNAN